MLKRRHFLTLALTTLAAPVLAQVPATGPMGKAERAEVLRTLADRLAANFVFPEVGARYAGMLREKADKDAYADLTDPTAFGERVTADLQAINRDGHLRLAPVSVFQNRAPRPQQPDMPASAKPNGPQGLEDASMIGDVAYLRFNGFFGETKVIAAVRNFLVEQAATARAVIIDARPHRGGGLDEMDAILPLLFAQSTTLVRMDTRASAFARGMPAYRSLVRQDAPDGVIRQDHMVTPDKTVTRLQSVPVYYLTSRRTASAAEHLAMAFKRTKRATIIGEKTYGAGHFGGVEEISGRFAAFIPVGRSYDPDDGWGWEGQGVAPDIVTHADDALNMALEMASRAGARPTPATAKP
ncbi:hypothetical protein CHU95_08445 [Niveispirillum lacus]|uniref:Tail specific protease domain-containing protein n=1 Tax=Niveispirillum lacus TaxID=1981099 RepID=A0A255Z167_9PROT|nr:S41 family peptidase [Niveispirillum lacus]OYQ35247.1 hypothetical protein CHU95_08445 [Niveispirillum lacus]